MKIETRDIVFPAVVTTILAWAATAILLGIGCPTGCSESRSAGFLVGLCILLTAFTVYASFTDEYGPTQRPYQSVGDRPR